jgi:hypothetical protein
MAKGINISNTIYFLTPKGGGMGMETEKTINKNSENIENSERIPDIKDILMKFDDIVVPLRYLPSKIKVPRKFIVARVTLNIRRSIPAMSSEKTFYFLVSEYVIIDIVNRKLYYKAKSGKTFRIPLFEEDLPKNLSSYLRSVDIDIFSNEFNPEPNIINFKNDVLINMTYLVKTFIGNIEFVNTEKFIASLLFNIYDDIALLTK